ncbi:hypothetical protein BDV96DRAFT_203189 [Lophiotrema nucula]|uniref:Uncharacterized protein n=1 Tax=Lophiotrema nucula TaxID=690887 RepID=A0A6A5ZNQ8_9PLEO|nr:hypothetical protein BDV96DRAFT_203189 [Lophiotrema nucula]
MSTLEQLPQALRRRIFRYLLVSDSVRQPHNHLLVEHYSFEVNLLRVNKAVNKDAADILYTENVFVKLDWSWDENFKAMYNHEVPFFKLSKSFDHHFAEIIIKFKIGKNGGSPCLLLLDDIPKLARLLRILDLANFMGFDFIFNLRQPLKALLPLNVTQQEQLLAPFERVRGTGFVQKVSIKGPVDMSLAQRVQGTMTQKVQWLRGGAWEIHDLARDIKRKGDLAFSLNNADMAKAKFDDSRNFDETAFKRNSMMEGIDQKLHRAMLRMVTINWVDCALLAISDATFVEEGRRLYEAPANIAHHIELAEKTNIEKSEEIVPKAVIARFYHINGVAEFGLGHPVKAAKSFAKAYKILPTARYKSGYELGKCWKNLTEDTRKSRLEAELAALPKKPINIPDMKRYSTPEVASEHWIMRQLGYQGDIPYADMIASEIAICMTTKPHPNQRRPGPRTARIGEVHEEVLRKRVDKLRKTANGPVAKGRLISWVGLKADQLGSTSILDDPAQADMLQDMSDNLRSQGCSPQ